MEKRGFICINTILFTLFAMPFASSIWIKGMTAEAIYGNVQDIPQTELAVVLGAAAYSPTAISDALQDRLDTAIELYDNGKVEHILLTGAANEVIAMHNYLIGQGLLGGAILEDPAGINTLASIGNIPEKYRKITVITQRYHLPRALFYARHAGFDAIGLPADRREYTKIFEFKTREILANTKAMLETLFAR